MAQDLKIEFKGSLYRGQGLVVSLWLFNERETCGMSLSLSIVGLHNRIDGAREHIVHALFLVGKMLYVEEKNVGGGGWEGGSMIDVSNSMSNLNSRSMFGWCIVGPESKNKQLKNMC